MVCESCVEALPLLTVHYKCHCYTAVVYDALLMDATGKLSECLNLIIQ